MDDRDGREDLRLMIENMIVTESVVVKDTK